MVIFIPPSQATLPVVFTEGSTAVVTVTLEAAVDCTTLLQGVSYLADLELITNACITQV